MCGSAAARRFTSYEMRIGYCFVDVVPAYVQPIVTVEESYDLASLCYSLAVKSEVEKADARKSLMSDRRPKTDLEVIPRSE